MSAGKRCAVLACLVLLSIVHGPVLAGACDKRSLQTNLTQIESNLAKPSVQKQIAAAQADYAADQDFDNIEPALYLDAYAIYIDIKKSFSADAIDAACTKYDNSTTLFELLEAAE